MVSRATLSVLLALVWPLALLAQAPDKEGKQPPKPRLAVAPLEVYGAFPEKQQAGLLIADYLYGKVASDRFRLVERAALASLLPERRFALEQVQRLDGDVLKGIRELADQLVVGSVGKIEDVYTVSLRLYCRTAARDFSQSSYCSGGLGFRPAR